LVAGALDVVLEPGVALLGVVSPFGVAAAPGVVLVPDVARPAVLVGAVLVRGAVTPPLPGTVVLAPGCVAVAVVAVVACGGIVAAPGAVAGLVAAGATAVGCERDVELSPASLTSAAASTPSARAATVAITARGRRQLGAAARRVRAAAPQRRHHSCCGRRNAPHRGHASPRRALPEGGTLWGWCSREAAALTRLRRAAA
jgi:hypothetical protein